MATAPRKGLNPARNVGSAPDNKAVDQYNITSGFGTALGAGDIVALSSGVIGAPTNGQNVLGVFHGCYYIDSTGRIQYQKYWPAGQTSTEQPTALIMDNYNALFNGLADGPIPLAKVGDIYKMNLSAPDANVGHSTMTIATTTTLTGTLAVAGTNNAGLAGLANNDTFTIKSTVANIVGSITIVTNQTPAQLLALLNAVPGISASYNGSNFLVVSASDGGNIVLVDGAGTPLADSNLLTTAGTYTSVVAANAGMVQVTKVVDTFNRVLEVRLVDHVLRPNGI